MMLKRTALLMLFLVLAGSSMLLTAFPYPPYSYAAGFGSQSTNQDSDNAFVQSQWNTWKSTYITSSGAQGFLRVQRPQDSYDSVSEGMGYGMLFSIYMDDRATFDQLYNYVKLYQDGNALMNWQVNSSGTIIGTGPATDADEDIALALIFADKKWGGYRTEALRVLNGAYAIFVEAGTNVLKPGDWGGSANTNISYYMPAAYRIFADYTGQAGWNNVVNKCYEVLNLAKNPSTFLVPDWCKADGTRSTRGYDYYNDAVRTPWRTSIDYLWNVEARALAFCTGITAFFNGIGAANIKNGYRLDGTYLGSGKHANILYQSTAGVGALSSDKPQFAKDCYNIIMAGQSVVGYYEDDLRFFSLLAITGNFPNLYTYTASTPAPTTAPTDTPNPTALPTEAPTPVPGCSYGPGDANGSGAIDIVDALVIAQYYVGIGVSNFQACASDVNKDGSIDIVDALRVAQCYVGIVSCIF
jgi:endo-1,4-beta-D-glucanase Y